MLASATRPAACLGILLLGLTMPSLARAVEDGNPFVVGRPAVPPYAADQRLMISDPVDGSVLDGPPDRIEVNFRRFEFQLEPSSLELWIDQTEYTQSLQFDVDRAWFEPPAQFFFGEGSHVLEARIRDTSGTYYSVTSRVLVQPLPCPGGCLWPIGTGGPNVVSNTMEDWQDFNTTPYFHSGIDIRAPAGWPVHSCTDGVVVQKGCYMPGSWSPYLYYEVAVQDPSGYIWQYHHVSESSVTVNIGDPVVKGQLLATIVPWPADADHQLPPGVVYNHLHLNVVRWLDPGPVGVAYHDGFEHYNPLRFLVKGSPDAVSPHTFEVYFTANESPTVIAKASDPTEPVLSGGVDVVARLRDQRDVLGSIGGEPYELGIYRLAYRLTALDTPCGIGGVPLTSFVRFNTMPGGSTVATQEKLVREVYRESLDWEGGPDASRYSYDVAPRYFYSITNKKSGFIDAAGCLDTGASGPLGALHPDGHYLLEIYAIDFYGNTTVTPVNVQISNGLDYTGICPSDVAACSWRLPLEMLGPGGEVATFLAPETPLTFGQASAGSAGAVVDDASWPAWYFDFPQHQMRVAVGLLRGHQASFAYWPLLGDVVVDVDAEVQVLPLGGVFDRDAQPAAPSRLRLSTRLARDPMSGDALIGHPATHGDPGFDLVLAQAIQAQGETMIVRSQNPGNARWEFHPTGVPESPPAPVGLQVAVYPNPFNPSTTIRFSLQDREWTRIAIYDASGRRVRLLVDEAMPAGTHEIRWDGTTDGGRGLGSGIYFCRTEAGSFRETRRLALVK